MQKTICQDSKIILLSLYLASLLAQQEAASNSLQSQSSLTRKTAQSVSSSQNTRNKQLAQAASTHSGDSKAAPGGTAERPDCRTLVLLNYRLRQRGDYQSAERVLQEAEKIAATDQEKILVHNALGGLYMQTQNDLQSEANFRKALALLQKTAKADSLDMATILDNLSVVCSSAKKFSEAESLNSMAIEIYRKNKNAPNATLDLITVLGNRGYILSRQGKHKEALASYQEAVSNCQSGERVPPSLYATMMDNLGSAYFLLGEYDQAEHARVDALALFESSQGQEHPETIKARRNLAAVYIKEGRMDEAADLLKKSIEVLKKSGSVNKNLLNSCMSDFEYCQMQLAAKKSLQDQRSKAADRTNPTDAKSATTGKAPSGKEAAAPEPESK